MKLGLQYKSSVGWFFDFVISFGLWGVFKEIKIKTTSDNNLFQFSLHHWLASQEGFRV
jgi:hypothetical protein